MVHHTRSRPGTRLAVVILACSMFSATGTLLATDGPEPSKSPVRRFKKKRASATNDTHTRYRPRLMIMAQHQLSKLQVTIKASMELTDEQTASIDEVFAAMQTELLRGNRPGPAFDPNAPARSTTRTPFPKTLRGAADIARLKRRLASSGAQNGPASGISPLTSRRAIVDTLAYEFHGLQQNQFIKIAARWDAMEPMVGLPDGPLLRLRRCVLDPELKLTASEMEDAVNIIGASMRKHGATRSDRSKMIAVADEARAKVLALMTPRQQQHLIENNRAMDKEVKILEAKIAHAEAEADAQASLADDSENANDVNEK